MSTNNTGLPAGIKLANTSFGQQQGTYNPSFQSSTQLKIDTTAQHQKGRPGGGWDDDDDIQPTLNTGNGSGGLIKPTYGTTTTTTTTTSTFTSFTPSTGGSFSQSNKSSKPSDLELIPVTDKFLQDHEYEHKLILDTILPGGARLKQADTVLNTFLKAAESLNVPVVSSIIISKLQTELVFVSKARAIYDIEILVKKLGKYYEFFKQNLSTLKGINFAQTESNSSNVSQLNNILQSVIKYIEDPLSATAKPTIQSQPYSPSIQQSDATNLLELDEPAPKKNDAFSFIKKTDSNSSQSQSSTEASPKKANAFGFINKPSGTGTDASPSTLPQQQQKTNAFGFIKGSQPQTSQATQPTQTTQQQQPQQKNRYEFLEMDFNDNTTTGNQNTTQTVNMGGLYGTSNTTQSTGFGGGLSGLDFGTAPQQQQGGFGGGFGATPQQQQVGFSGGFGTSPQQQVGFGGGFGTTPQQQGGFGGGFGTSPTQAYGNGYGTYNAGNFSQGSMGYNQPSNLGYNQGSMGFNQNAGGSFNYSNNFQGMQTQFSNLNLGLEANNEAEKKKKEQQETEEKLFDFVKF